MNRRLAGIALLSVASLFAACKEEVAPPPPPGAPTIDVFKVDRSEVAPGESALLSFSVSLADEVELLDDGGERVPFDGSAFGGTAVVTPAQTSVYVLRATGPGGRASAFVQVAVGEALRSVILLAVPPEVDPGGAVDLVWSAQGASSVSLTDGSGASLQAEGTAGVFSLNPEQSARYTLTAQGPNGVTQSATADVRVRPVLDSLEVAPGVVKAGEALTFTWRARGADQVLITEKTFGPVHSTSSASAAASGEATWTVPTTLPEDGGQVPEGFRLEFTVAVRSSQPDVTLTRTVVRHLGAGPVIHALSAPETVTAGTELRVGWTVTGTQRLQLYANGLLVSEPGVADDLGFEQGSVKLPAPKFATTYRLVAHGFDGATTAASTQVTLTSPPELLGFQLSDTVPQVGDAAIASWSTSNASLIQLRVKNGPVVYSTRDPAKVAQGQVSVFPGRSAVYVLDAINEAGTSVSAERALSLSGAQALTTSPSHPKPNDAVTVSWDLPPGDVLEVIGVPTAKPVKIALGSEFVDLGTVSAARPLKFVNPDDDVAELPASVAFRFPLMGSVFSRFVASTNGFLALEPSQPLPQNLALPAAQRLPAMLAPLWDDLIVGGGQVLYAVDGAEFPRRLVVQWSGVALKDQPGSRLDFQVQLYESGEVRFAYNQLDGGAAGAADLGATIGVHAGAFFSAAHSVDTGGSVAAGDELGWFLDSAPSGGFTVPLQSTTRFSLFYRRANGELVHLSQPVTVWGKDLISIREAMPQPLAPVLGQWLELQNTSQEEVSLAGTQLFLGTSAALPLPDWTTLAPGQTLVLGQSADVNETGGAPVDEVVAGLSLAAADSVELRAGDLVISQLAWTASTLGQSVEREQRVLDGTGAQKACTRSATYGTDGALGTPGSSLESCWDYTLEPIAFAPQDVLGSGALVFKGPISGRKWVPVALADAAFPLFGAAYAEGLLSLNGYVSFVNGPGTLSDSYSYPLEKAPKFQHPNAAIVPFGDALDLDRPESAVVYRRIEPGELSPGSSGLWVFQWNRVTHVSDANADLTFQLKLFDDGVIELHYGAMVNGTHATAFGEGADAASWVENAEGTEALVVNVFSRTPGIQSYTAFRFTPAQ